VPSLTDGELGPRIGKARTSMEGAVRMLP
jgi:hypothetical protein